MAVNLSKKRSPIIAAKWKKSGAIGNIESATMQKEKQNAIINSRKRLNYDGNLNEKEVERLITYHFLKWPRTIGEQVERYFLELKSNNPKLAEKLLIDLKTLDLSNIKTLDKIKKLCLILDKYISGIVIRFQGKTYQVENGKVYLM